VDLVGVGGRQAGEAEHDPGNLVAVAPVHRIGEEALHHHGVEANEKGARGETLELRGAVLHGGERGGALGWREAIELLAVGLAGPFIGGGDAGREILARRERELIALLGLAAPERTAAVYFRARPVGAGELAVDVSDDAAIGAGR